mgnify:CR=1 FL=1
MGRVVQPGKHRLGQVEKVGHRAGRTEPGAGDLGLVLDRLGQGAGVVALDDAPADGFGSSTRPISTPLTEQATSSPTKLIAIRSRNRRRPSAPSVQSLSIAGTSQTTRTIRPSPTCGAALSSILTVLGWPGSAPVSTS